jgi:hypothetical protein
VVKRDELASVSSAGPLSSIDRSIDWTVSDIAENGTISSFNNVSINREAARDDETDATTREALCHADTQYDKRSGSLEED